MAMPHVWKSSYLQCQEQWNPVSLSQKQNIRGLLSGVPLSGKWFLHAVWTKETWIFPTNIKIPLSIFLNFSLCQIKSPIRICSWRSRGFLKFIYFVCFTHCWNHKKNPSVREGDGRNPNLSSCYEKNSLWSHPPTVALFHFHSKLWKTLI